MLEWNPRRNLKNELYEVADLKQFISDRRIIRAHVERHLHHYMVSIRWRNNPERQTVMINRRYVEKYTEKELVNIFVNWIRTKL